MELVTAAHVASRYAPYRTTKIVGGKTITFIFDGDEGEENAKKFVKAMTSYRGPLDRLKALVGQAPFNVSRWGNEVTVSV